MSPLDRAIAILSGQAIPDPVLAVVILALDERDRQKVLLKLKKWKEGIT